MENLMAIILQKILAIDTTRDLVLDGKSDEAIKLLLTSEPELHASIKKNLALPRQCQKQEEAREFLITDQADRMLVEKSVS